MTVRWHAKYVCHTARCPFEGNLLNIGLYQVGADGAEGHFAVLPTLICEGCRCHPDVVSDVVDGEARIKLYLGPAANDFETQTPE